jgi:hypothetical protein
MKAAIRPSQEPTTDAAWDGPANEARLPNDGGAALFRQFYAWVDPEADPETKAAYKFGHHMVSTGGDVGAANLVACSTGIAVLNGGRGGTNIPDADKKGVHAHLAQHMMDGDMEPPELRSKAAPVKFVAGSDNVIEGLAIPFGGPINGKDLDGEFFTPDTNFCLDWFPIRPLIYDHGLDPTIKTAVIGQTVDATPSDVGLWARVQLDVRNRYLRAIQDLVQGGALGFSSGAMAHLVKVDEKSGEIKQWPWVELSTTPTPANPDAIVYTVKSWAQVAQHMAALDDDSGSESFDDQGSRVVAAVEDYAERTRKRLTHRAAKVGRELSATNREWLRSLDERLAALMDLRGEIKEALRRTDPEAQKQAQAAYFRFLETQAADLGVPLTEN